MKDPVDRAVRAIARRNSIALVWAQFAVSHLVLLGGLGLLLLYQPMSPLHFWLLVGLSQLLVGIDNLASIGMVTVMGAPVRRWERTAPAERTTELTVAAWHTLVTLPTDYVKRVRAYPFTFFYLPYIAFAAWLLHLRWYSFFIITAAGTAVIAYGLIARYLAVEVVVRPVLEPVAAALPPDFRVEPAGLSLQWRLLAVAPVINVITCVVVAGLSSHGRHVDLADLGISWLVAIAVSFTISLELVVLGRSPASSISDLQRATEAVASGDLHARVPVVTTDETGRLAQSFNSMIEGLDEGERLRPAFGAYVDPGLAERVLTEGADLGGEEREVSILFLDVRNFAGRISVGIGINSGPVVAGTVGGGGRVEFSVIGDTVNTASWVESATRLTGDAVLITDAARALLADGGYAMTERPGTALRGKQAPVRLWAPRLPDRAPSDLEREGVRPAPVAD